jgi:hypothetical protein
MLRSCRDRIAAATGALFVVLVMVGIQLDVSGTDQSAHPTGASVLRDVAHQTGSTTHTIGFVLELIGFTCLLGFLGYLVDAGRRAGHGRGGTATTVAAFAGLTTLIVKLSLAAPIGALAVDRTEEVLRALRAGLGGS